MRTTIRRWFRRITVATLLPTAVLAGPSRVLADGVTLDFASLGAAPTYRASGFIYGMAADGSQPADRTLLTDIKTRFLRVGGAQLGSCPGGFSLYDPDDESSLADYELRWSSVLAYYAIAHEIGATVHVASSDLWGADGCGALTTFPGDGDDWTKYEAFLARVTADAEAAGMTGPDVRWELWNEPDLTYFWNLTVPADVTDKDGYRRARYLEMIKRGHAAMRAAIPESVIVGPSFAGGSWWSPYFTYIKDNDIVPNYLVWHDEGGGNDPVSEVAARTAQVASLGITVDGYDINEYGTSAEQNPGHSAWFIARLERAGADGARGNWGGGSGLWSRLGALTTTTWQPNAQWWVYKRYGDQTGQKVSVTPGAQVDAVAFADSTASKSIIVVGNKGGATGEVDVVLNDLPAWLQDGGTTSVLLEQMPNLTTAVTAPTTVSHYALPVTNDSLTVKIAWTDAKAGYAITLTPTGGSPPPDGGGGGGGGCSTGTGGEPGGVAMGLLLALAAGLLRRLRPRRRAAPAER